MTYNYVTVSQAIEKHDEIIEKSGGKTGLRRGEHGLRSVIELVQDDGFYPDFIDKVAHVMFAVNKNHPFVDGNKRSSIVIAAYFLEINFVDQLMVDLFIKESENLALLIAQNYMDKELLKKIIRDIISDGELSEDTKIAYAQIVAVLPVQVPQREVIDDR